MILVDNYFLAILCCVICCACWGSWANTQKMVAAKQWSFELFYWDLTVGLFLTALLGAVTLGSMGSEGRTFFQDLAVMDWSSIQYAFLGGVVWNFGNIFLTAAIAVAGMSVGFPIGWRLGLDWRYCIQLFINLFGRSDLSGKSAFTMEWCVSHHCSYTDLRKSVRKVIVRQGFHSEEGDSAGHYGRYRYHVFLRIGSEIS